MTDSLTMTASDIDEIRRKINSHEWAANLYAKIKDDRSFQELGPIYSDQETVTHMWREGTLLRERSLIYAISGDDSDVQKMIDILEERFFQQWKYEIPKPKAEQAENQKREAVAIADYWMFWLELANHVFAFNLIKNHPLFGGSRLSRFEQFFLEALEIKKKTFLGTIALQNCQFWDATGLGMLGIMCEDADAVDLAINGRFGFKFMLNKFADGLFWPEATVYGFGYVCSCALMLAEACAKNGHEDLYAYSAPSGGSIKSMFDGWIKLMFTDGRVATHGDHSHYSHIDLHQGKATGRHESDIFMYDPKQNHINGKIEVAYKAYKDPTYAWILSHTPARDLCDSQYWGYAGLTHGIPLEEIKTPSAESAVFAESGTALIRSDETAKYWESDALAVFARQGNRMGHTHDDPYHITLNAFKKNIYPDWFVAWDYRGGIDPKTGKERSSGPFSRRVFGHNTIVIDGKDPDLKLVRILPIERSGGMQIIRMISGVDGGAYKWIYQTRIIGVTKEYVLDAFDIRCGHWIGRDLQKDLHTYDYLLHSFGTVQAEGLSNFVQDDLEDVRTSYGVHQIDSAAKNSDNFWIRPGYRGKAAGAWRAIFEDNDDIGSVVYMAGEPGTETEVMTTTTPYEVPPLGWDFRADDIERNMPLLIARRNAAYSMFVAVHQPFRGTPEFLDIRKDDRKLYVSGKGFHDVIDLECFTYQRDS